MSRRAGFWLASLALAAGLAVRPGAGAPDFGNRSAQCAECHQQVWNQYRRTRMGRSFSRLDPTTRQADFRRRNTFYHAASGRYYEAIEREGRFFLRRYQLGFDSRPTNVVEMEIHYAFGSGNHARGYLHRTADDRLLQLPLTWYSDQGGFWAMAPGYDRPDHAGFRREIDRECMFCHNAYPPGDEGQERPGAAVRFQRELPEGIDCQRCHGPGLDHAAAARRGEPAAVVRERIVNPALLSSERQLEICMQCHLETTTSLLPHAIRRFGRGYFSYIPGQPLAEYVLHFDHAPGKGYDDKFEVVSAAYRLRQSSCFQRSSGALVCTSCHDPHRPSTDPEATARYQSACRQCHDRELRQRIGERSHVDSPDCVGCHMPKRAAQDAVHVRMTDHKIAAKPLQMRSPGLQEDAGDGRYRGEVRLYYPEALGGGDDDADLYLALAQVKDGSNIAAGVPKLERSIRRSQRRHPEPSYYLAKAYQEKQDLKQAISRYSEALETDPDFWPAALGRGQALAASGDFVAAAEAIERALRAAPREPAVLVALGDVYYRLGRLNEARKTFRSALSIDPNNPEAHNNLGAVLFTEGKSVAAQAEFREAVRHRPDYAAAHVNLAQLLAQEGVPAEAAYHYAQALRYGSLSPEIVAGYGLTLAASGRRTEARRYLIETAQRSAGPIREAAHATLRTLESASK